MTARRWKLAVAGVVGAWMAVGWAGAQGGGDAPFDAQGQGRGGPPREAVEPGGPRPMPMHAGGAGAPFAGRIREAGGGEEPDAEGMIMGILNSPAMARELGLTDEQIEPLKSGLFELRGKEIELKAQMEKAGLEQARLMTEKDVDEAAVMAAVEKAGAIRTEMAKLRVRGLLLVKRHISPEQIERIRGAFRDKMRERFRQHREGGEFDGPPGQGQGQGGMPPRERDRRPASAWRGPGSEGGGSR